MDPTSLSLTEAADLIAAKKISALELTDACLAQIAATQPAVNAFIAVETDLVRAAARAADECFASDGPSGSLHGVPLAHKDMYYRAGMISTCGAKIRRNFIPEHNATALARLSGAGALQLGTLGMAEFASNPTGHNEHFGNVNNPWNTAHVTGGSSSGSGAAVAALQCFGALGSDTGGSIRLPAAFCGVSGMKATYGRVSRYGAMPLSSSMDHVGPLARTVRDCARLLQVMAGADPGDPTASTRPVPDWEGGIAGGVAGMKIALAGGWFAEGLHPALEAALEEAMRLLVGQGAERVDVDVPDMRGAAAAGAALARGESGAIHAKWLRDRPEDYTRIVRDWLEIGLAVPAPTYMAALNLRGPTLAAFKQAVFGKADLLIAPTTAGPALSHADTTYGIEGYGAANAAIPRFTRPFNYLGLPALAIPCGFTAEGLPLSLQIVGRPYDEMSVFQAGFAFQTATDWHERHPSH